MSTLNYFAGCVKVAEIKARFRELALQLHPDRGGDLRAMQALNAQYHERLKALHNSETFEGGEKHTYYYNEATEAEIASIVSQLLALNLPNVSIDIIGLYVWITGDTKPVKDRIKSIDGTRYHSKRQCWFFKPERLKNYKPRFSGKSLDELAETYGRKSYRTTANAPTNR